MPATRNDLPSNVRATMIALLNARLADALDLKPAVKQAHWNVKGRSLIALHELFDAVAGRVEGPADELAKRAVMLGGIAVGTTQAVAKET